jgi:hypothetical protein
VRDKPKVVSVHDGGDGEWGVTTLLGGGRGYQTRPCPTCPWRRDAPTGVFPPEVFRHSASTTYDLASNKFACHMSGRERPKTCAGFLLRGASDNLSVRMNMGEYTGIDSTVDLYDDYREMAVANGVHPDDPALAPCRGDRPMEYPPHTEEG